MKPIRFHQSAIAELDEAIAYYEEQRVGLGLDLNTEVERAVNRIQENPAIGAHHKNTQFQFSLVRRFPFVVFYRELDETIWIVAIAHGKRRPDYWSRRRVR